MPSPQRGPLLGRFLNTIFAEIPHASRNQRLNLLDAALLGHRDKSHFLGLAPRGLAARRICSRTLASRVAASLIRRAIGRPMATNQPSWPREWLMTDERSRDRR